MASVPKKLADHYAKTVSKFQCVLKAAVDRDINEADTVAIVKDIFSDVMGFDKYTEITREYAIRGTFCDLAIKIEDKLQYLVEVKAIGLDLKENHLRQAVNYGVNQGVQWVVLTNGVRWELYRIRFERPVKHELVSSFDFLDLKPKKSEDQEILFLFSSEGLDKSAREDYYERVKCVNRFVIGNLVLSDPIVTLIRREVKKLSKGLKLDKSEVDTILRKEVLKRDVIEGEEAAKALARVKQIARKTKRPQKPAKRSEPTSTTSADPALHEQSESGDGGTD